MNLLGRNQRRHILSKCIKESCYLFWEHELALLKWEITKTEGRKREKKKKCALYFWRIINFRRQSKSAQ